MFRIFAPRDEQLVQRAIKGRRDAFETLARRYLPCVRAVAYARTGNFADAEDAAQETFLRALQGLESLREANRFGAWLLGIARNVTNQLRTSRAKESAAINEAPVAGVSHPDVERHELRAIVRQRLEELDEPHCEIILLHYFAGKKLTEVALLLEISQEAARKRLQRAREMLGALLLNDLQDDANQAAPFRRDASRIVFALAAIPFPWGTATQSAVSSTATAGAGLAGAIMGTKTIVAGGVAALIVAGAIIALVLHQEQKPPLGLSQTSSQTAPDQTPENVRFAPNGSTPAMNQSVSEPAANSRSVPTASVANTLICVNVLSRDGAPEPEALVTATRVPGEDEAVDVASIQPRTEQTDNSGKAMLRGLPNGYYLINASKDTRAAQGGSLLTNDAPGEEQTLILAPAADIEGRVLDGQGQPVAAARVVLFKKNNRMSLKLSTATGQDGTYRFPTLPPGNYQFAAEAEGYARGYSEVVPPGARGVDVVLARGGRITGVVRQASDKKMLAGIGIGAHALATDQSVPKTMSDADGRFSFDGLAADVYTVYGSDEKMVLTMPGPRVDLRHGQTSNDLELLVETGTVVSGTVVSKVTQEPVKGVNVEVLLGDGYRWISRSVTTTTDNAGNYTVKGIPPGYITITFTKHGASRGSTRVSIPPGLPEVTADYALPPDGVNVSGQVVDAGGEPMLSAVVRVWVPTGIGAEWSDYARTDAEGNFRLTKCRVAENARIMATSDQGDSPVSAPFSIPESGIEGLALKLGSAKMASISGTTVDSRGAPALARIRVLLLSEEDAFPHNRPRDGYSEADGFFLVRGLPPGEYQLFVGPYDNPLNSRPPVQEAGTVTVKPGEQRKNLRLTVDMGVGIGGTVTDEAGVPVPFASVALYSREDRDFCRSARTDAVGQFALRSVPDGTYVVTAGKDGVGNDVRVGVNAGESVDLVLSLTKELDPIWPKGEGFVRPLE